MKKRRYPVILSLLFLILGIAGGLFCLSTPKAYSGLDDTRYSAVHAASWIEKIAEKPHSVFDKEAHQAVLGYIISELNKLGLEVTTQEYTTNKELDGLTITNIHARLDGKSDDAVLLVSHYDSGTEWNQTTWEPLPGVSYGAADAGYGVATILETLKVIKAQNKPLENDIQVLITDAEELGCVGAYYEMDENIGAYQNVRLVINLEARGIKGPAVMFETGINNSAVANYYIKHANQPFSYSFATDIYHMMPNGTDFTTFIQKGFTGYNFAVIDNLDYYHTANDNYGNIDLNSLQHYGDQVCPIVADFAFTPGQLPSFKSDSGSNFFNLLPGVIIGYPQSVTLILLGLGILLLISTIVIGIRKRLFRLSKMFAALGRMFLSLVAAALLGTLITYIASLIFNRQFYITYLPRIPFAGLILTFVLILGTAVFVLMIRKPMKKKPAGLEVMAGGILFNILLSVLACLLLPGCAFLFVIPALLTGIYSLLAITVKNRLPLIPAYALIALMVPILFIPLIYMFYLALTLGAAGIVAAFALIALFTFVPVLYHYLKD